jgi:hypothetical protein
MKEKLNKIINMDKKLKISIVILLIWLCLNIYVTYFQEKILIVGDWPHKYFMDDYWNPLKKYSWAPSLGFVELSGYYRFNKVYVHLPVSVIESSNKNIEVIKKLEKYAKEIYIRDSKKNVDKFRQKYNFKKCRSY